MVENQQPNNNTDEPRQDASALPAEELVPEEEEFEETKESEAQVLERELALLESQLQDLRDRYLRAVADLDNVRKRTRRELREAQHRALASVLLDLLPVVDNFERALETAAHAASEGDSRAIYDGVVLIYRQLMAVLERRGVKPIPAVGERFDPSRHEAVAQVPAGPGQEEGVVALETQKGYLLGDEVLRPSRVGVTVHTTKES